MDRRYKICNNYDDIIDLPCPVSKKHPQMSLHDRAAQFAPFAALTGHESAIEETARLTGEKRELDEYAKNALNDSLLEIMSRIKDEPFASIVYFRPDTKKSGGAYTAVSGNVKKIDLYTRAVIMSGGLKIPIDDIAEIETQAL